MFIKPGKYIWRSGDVDYPVTVIESLGEGPDGRIYLKIAESVTAIPFDEIVFNTSWSIPNELTSEEAEAAYNSAPEIPISAERIEEIVKYATSRKPVLKRIFE